MNAMAKITAVAMRLAIIFRDHTTALATVDISETDFTARTSTNAEMERTIAVT